MQSGVLGVTGYRGLLGNELVKCGCVPIEADITNAEALHNAIAQIKPDVVINCAAFTNVDACESEPGKAAQANAVGVYNLSQVFTGKIVHISTDFVFDGKAGPYRETDAPNPVSVYGWSKLGGEIIITNRKLGDLIVRVTTPFGVHPVKATLVSKILDRLKVNLPLRFPDELTSSPSYLPDMARAILEAVEKDTTGILNIAGNRAMPLKEFAQSIARIAGYDPGVIGSGPPVGIAPRPMRGGLVVEKALKNGIFINDPLIGLQETIDALEKMENG